MGDRYELDNVKCPYCGHICGDIWYAPTCNSVTSKCDKCKKEFFINHDFKGMKMKDVELDDVLTVIRFTSNMMNDTQMKSCAIRLFEELKGKKKK